jgi:hypothetical protein
MHIAQAYQQRMVDDIKEHVFQVDLNHKDGVVLTNKVSIMLQWVG